MDLHARLDAAIDSALSRRKIVGTVLLVARDGEVVYRRAAGLADREAGRPMREDAIFRLASVTKPFVAATALALVDAGLLALDDRVADHLPYFTPRLADGTPAAITIRHLLTHTSGLTYDYGADPQISTGLDATDLGFEENFSRVAALPLAFTPGSAWRYSIAIDVLGAVVAKVHGGSLDAAVRRHVGAPLGLEDTGFAVRDMARLATPYANAEPEPVPMAEGQVVVDKDGNRTVFFPSRTFNPKAYQSGGAGMAGTADDVLTFLEALRRGGAPILRPETAASGLANQIGTLTRDDPGQGFGFFGGVIVDAAASGTAHNAGAVHWGGIYGHNWFIDPVERLTVVSLSNTAPEGCNGPYRDEIRNAVYGA